MPPFGPGKTWGRGNLGTKPGKPGNGTHVFPHSSNLTVFIVGGSSPTRVPVDIELCTATQSNDQKYSTYGTANEGDSTQILLDDDNSYEIAP